tara:strand:- start:97 stop:399 length:303 start_codon:yes stop_codon:yes gene_type:complete
MPATLSEKLLSKHPNRIPIIFESKNIELAKTKFLVPNDITVAQTMAILRNYTKVKSYEALFMLINNTLPVSSTSLSELYDTNKDKDGILHICITKENTFG